MPTVWLKVMLEEVARKRAEAAEARAEDERRHAAARDVAGGADGAPRISKPAVPAPRRRRTRS